MKESLTSARNWFYLIILSTVLYVFTNWDIGDSDKIKKAVSFLDALVDIKSNGLFEEYKRVELNSDSYLLVDYLMKPFIEKYASLSELRKRLVKYGFDPGWIKSEAVPFVWIRELSISNDSIANAIDQQASEQKKKVLSLRMGDLLEYYSTITRAEVLLLDFKDKNLMDALYNHSVILQNKKYTQADTIITKLCSCDLPNGKLKLESFEKKKFNEARLKGLSNFEKIYSDTINVGIKKQSNFFASRYLSKNSFDPGNSDEKMVYDDKYIDHYTNIFYEMYKEYGDYSRKRDTTLDYLASQFAMYDELPYHEELTDLLPQIRFMSVENALDYLNSLARDNSKSSVTILGVVLSRDSIAIGVPLFIIIVCLLFLSNLYHIRSLLRKAELREQIKLFPWIFLQRGTISKWLVFFIFYCPMIMVILDSIFRSSISVSYKWTLSVLMMLIMGLIIKNIKVAKGDNILLSSD